MNQNFVWILILILSFFTQVSQARLPSDTGPAFLMPQVVTCQLKGFSRFPGGPQSSVYVDVQAASLEQAIQASISTQSHSQLDMNGEVRLLKIEMGQGQFIWAESISCGSVELHIADCCKAVCGTCLR